MSKHLTLALCLIFSVHTSYANQKAELADATYAQRDFNEAGVKKALEAVTLYGEAVAEEADSLAKLNLMLAQATAHYFLGTAMSVKDDRKAQHRAAMDVSDAIMTEMGVNAAKAHELTNQEISDILGRLEADQELILADAMYSKGINLAQWGSLNGLSSSIGQLPVVQGLMQNIEKLGYAQIAEYGPYRTLGRIQFKLPPILGGNLKESEKFLKSAYRKTLVSGQKYSLNAYNNIYLAETLHKQGKENQAIKLLQTFLAADPLTLKADSEPENREAIRLAEKLMDDWK